MKDTLPFLCNVMTLVFHLYDCLCSNPSTCISIHPASHPLTHTFVYSSSHVLSHLST